MTCQECEIKLGMGEDASEHLASCAECKWLADELRLNAAAMREMRVRPVRWAWAVAVAAAIVMAFGLWRHSPHVVPHKEPPRMAAAARIGRPTGNEQVVVPPVKRVRAHRKQMPAEPLKVKMYTSDPDVVIYWIVDRKEGSE